MDETQQEVQDTETVITFGGEFKSLGDGKFGGYLVRFTTPKDPDLTGDFFTKSTEFGVRDGAELPLFYNHGLDGALKTRRIGTARVKFDDVGLWLEAQLEARDEYEKAIARMAEDGKMGLSSGAASHLVEREQVGKAYWLKTWIVAEGSLTPTPAEPRNTVISLKSYMSANEPEPETPPAQAETTATPSEETGNPTNGVKTMEIEETKLQEMLETASEKAIKGFIAAQPSAVEPDVQVVDDEADRALAGNPFKSAQEFFVSVKNAGVYPSETDKRLLPLKATGLNEAIPSQGGFLVPGETGAGILQGMYATGSLLSLMNRIPVSGNGLTLNAVDETSRATGSRFGGVRGYWMAEAATKTASKPSFRQIELKLKKVAALCVATDELLEDTTALTSWLQQTVPMELRFQVEDAIVNGDGVGKPLGILASGALNTFATRVDAAEIDAVDIGNMWAARAGEFNDYIWLVSPRAFPQLLNMVIGTTPAFVGAGGVSGLPYNTLLGRPMLETEYNAALGTAGDIILMSPSAYPMIEKSGGVQSASSIHVYFTSDESAFRFVYRVDGKPSWYTTRTEKDGSKTSPFVVLSAST